MSCLDKLQIQIQLLNKFQMEEKENIFPQNKQTRLHVVMECFYSSSFLRRKFLLVKIIPGALCSDHY